MKQIYSLPFIVSLLALLLSSCAASPSGTQSHVWPQATPFVAIYSFTEPVVSVDEAIGTIKNLQKDFVEWGAGIHFSNVDVDAYGLRVRWEWTETTQNTEYVPSYSGMFIGWNYVPIYGGSYQTQTLTEQKNDMLTLPFDEIVSTKLFHMPELDRKYKWGMEVWLQNDKRVAFRALDERTLVKLNRSITSLALNRGAPFRPALLGFDAAPLTSAQSHKLGIPPGTGLLVYSVAKGGPADNAGIRFLDVILELEQTPVKTPRDMVELLQGAYQANKPEVAAKIVSTDTFYATNMAKPSGKEMTGQVSGRTVSILLPK